MKSSDQAIHVNNKRKRKVNIRTWNEMSCFYFGYQCQICRTSLSILFFDSQFPTSATMKYEKRSSTEKQHEIKVDTRTRPVWLVSRYREIKTNNHVYFLIKWMFKSWPYHKVTRYEKDLHTIKKYKMYENIKNSFKIYIDI